MSESPSLEEPRPRTSLWERGLLVGLGIAVCAFLFHQSHPGPWELLTGRGGYYGLEASGFSQGRLSLPVAAPPGLTALKDPYDPVANAPWREAVPPLHDLSLFGGKLYLYFGVVPAVTLFLPFQALTGHPLPQWVAAWLFVAVGFAAGAWLILYVRGRVFPTAGVVSACLALLGLGLASGLPLLLSRADVYEVAIASGFCFTFLGWVAVVRALDGGGARAGWSALAGAAFALAVGSRPSLMVAIAASLVWVAWVPRMRTVRMGVAFGLPLVLIGSALGLFNECRFGSFFEWGQRFQLSNLHEGQVTHFSLRFVLTNLRRYLIEPRHWTAHFPFLRGLQGETAPPGYAGSEDPIALATASPFLLAAGLLLVLWPRFRLRDPLARSLVGGIACYGVTSLLFLSFYFLSAGRYEAEFAPQAGWGAGVGLIAADAAWAQRRSARAALRGVGLGLLVLSAGNEYLQASLHYAKSRNDFARVLLVSGQRSRAVAVLKDVVRDAPDLPEPHVNLGGAFATSGDARGAEVEFAAALWAEPRNFEARNNLADLLMQTGRPEEAVTQYRYAIELRPGQSSLHAHLAYALSKLGRSGEALAEWAQAARFDAQGIDACLAYGLALARSGQLAEAKAQFQIAAKRSPSSTASHSDLGTIEAMLGNYPEAVSEFQMCLRLDPSDSNARANLSEALRRMAERGDRR